MDTRRRSCSRVAVALFVASAMAVGCGPDAAPAGVTTTTTGPASPTTTEASTSTTERSATTSSTTAPAGTSSPPLEVVVVGDSLVFQSRQELRRMFDATHLRISAEPGETLSQQLDAVRSAVEREPDVVVVLLGTNDITMSTDDPYSRVRDAMDRLSPVPCVRWLTVAPIFDLVAEVRILNEVIRRSASSHDNVEVVEWGQRVERHPEWFRDLVHYGDEGQRALARTIVETATACEPDR